jgi:kynurenine formamidase
MSRIIDLSGPLYEGMWSYRGLSGIPDSLPAFGSERVAALETHGFEAFAYHMSSITGTYIETGGHMLPGMPSLGVLPTETFVRPAVVCHVSRKNAEEVIHAAELVAHCPTVQPGDALLIECGWGSRWEQPEFVPGSPAFHVDCLPWFMAQPFSILGVDVPCIESARSRPAEGDQTGNMLTPIFERGALLLAPLVNLDLVTVPRGRLLALPLSIRAVSGAPCRALLIEGDD